MRRLPPALLLPLLALIAFPAVASAQQGEPMQGDTTQAAQEGPPTLRISFFQCHQNQLGDVLDFVEQYDIPIWQELVDEGMIQSYGYFTHAWADEYNLGLYTIGRDIPAILAASEEAGSRAEERFPDAPDTMGEACPWHRDGFYTMGPGTEGAGEGAGQARPTGN